MRHHQVIHPVLQEVGLKMNLLDPTLAIDLQYLGVRLPIPPPGVSLEPLTPDLLPPPPQGVSAGFVSRTGKTTDVTQIKGWREKFTPSEAPPTPTPTPTNPEGSDVQKKNLSAFCSDMLDEYLENEGKLIDERAASFSSSMVEPLVYQLPTRSTSYVRTLDSVLKKQSSPTSDLISGFIPPSKRPKPPPRDRKGARKEHMRQRGPKPKASGPGPTPAEPHPGVPFPAIPVPAVPVPAVPAVPAVPVVPVPAELPQPVTESKKPKKPFKVRFHHTEPLSPSPKLKKKKPKTSSRTLSPPGSLASPADMPPLESDSELDDAGRKPGAPLMTRALLRQKDLEDGAVWEGRHRTCVTEERAAVALTSLFTLKVTTTGRPIQIELLLSP
ncbi:MAX gene-associated protein-like, partial [Etheostoma cragini]|uniref:MAX gene-associated protein-like n=1 Tax=Etheostoma cragini TaxID=417921 RepID=UPI00155E4D4F